MSIKKGTVEVEKIYRADYNYLRDYLKTEINTLLDNLDYNNILGTPTKLSDFEDDIIDIKLLNYYLKTEINTLLDNLDFEDLVNKPTKLSDFEDDLLHTVATTGSYDDLVDKPTKLIKELDFEEGIMVIEVIEDAD